MNNWDHYIKQSYDLVRRAESKLTVNLEEDIEAYVVMVFAHYMDKPQVNTEPVCIKLLESTSKPIAQRAPLLKQVGDECLLIHAMEWGKPRWPSPTYYQDMGQAAYINRAFVKRPPEMLYDDLAVEFNTVTNVLRHCRLN